MDIPEIVSASKKMLKPLHIIHECADCGEEFRAPLELTEMNNDWITKEVCHRCKKRKEGKNRKERLRAKLVWMKLSEEEVEKKLQKASKLN